MYIKLILLALIVMGQASESADFFQMLSKQEYGKTIIQTIQLELNTGGQVDNVLQQLHQMLDNATKEKNQIQSNVDARQSYCASRISAAKDVINQAEYKRADDEKKVPLRKESLEDKKQQTLDKSGEKQRNDDKIVAITNIREEQRKEYQTRRNELIGFVAALQEAKKIVKTSQSASFLQTALKEHYQSFKQSFPIQQGYGIMVELLLKTANQADPEVVEKVIQAIDTLIESIYDLQKEELLIEDQREEDYQKQKARLESANSHLAAAVATFQAQIQKIQQEILEIYNDIQSQKQISQSKNKELQDWVKTCNDEEKQLRTVFDQRTGQIEVLNEIIRIFNSGVSSELRNSIAEIQV